MQNKSVVDAAGFQKQVVAKWCEEIRGLQQHVNISQQEAGCLSLV